MKTNVGFHARFGGETPEMRGGAWERTLSEPGADYRIEIGELTISFYGYSPEFIDEVIEALEEAKAEAEEVIAKNERT